MTLYGVANLSSIPLRAAPSERAEMVSQLLFGDAYQVEEEAEGWLRIRTCDCQYEGWLCASLHNPLHEKDVDDYLRSEKYFLKDYLLFIKEFETEVTFPIMMGSSFPYPKDGMLILGDSVFKMELPKSNEMAPVAGLTQQQSELMRFAAGYLRTPYLWGGRTPAGIDCSGFSQIVYKSIGINLPRDASQQVVCGTTVDFVEEARPGDLAFFQNEGGNISHVGIVCGKNAIIHASCHVRIDTLDSTGIFCRQRNCYTHTLRIIKRLLEL